MGSGKPFGGRHCSKCRRDAPVIEIPSDHEDFRTARYLCGVCMETIKEDISHIAPASELIRLAKNLLDRKKGGVLGTRQLIESENDLWKELDRGIYGDKETDIKKMTQVEQLLAWLEGKDVMWALSEKKGEKRDVVDFSDELKDFLRGVGEEIEALRGMVRLEEERRMKLESYCKKCVDAYDGFLSS